MAGLANPPGFGANRWGEINWAVANRFIHVPFAVGGPTAWQPSIDISADRTISIAAGPAWCCGVFDQTDSAETVQLPANSGSTDRFDFIVASYDWSSRTRTFKYILGTNSYPAINSTQVLNNSQVNRIPGVRYDGIIAIIRTPPGRTTYQPADLWADVRPWGGSGGMLTTRTNANVSVIDASTGTMALSQPIHKEWLRTEAGWTAVDSGWQFSGIVAQSGWNVLSLHGSDTKPSWRTKDGKHYFRARIQRASGASVITADSDGNFTDQHVLTLPNAIHPPELVPGIAYRVQLNMATCHINTSGQLYLTSTYPGVSIGPLYTFEIRMDWLKD